LSRNPLKTADLQHEKYSTLPVAAQKHPAAQHLVSAAARSVGMQSEMPSPIRSLDPAPIRGSKPRLLRNAILAETLPASHAASRLCGEAFPPEESSRRKQVPPGRVAAVAGRTGFRR